MGLYLFLVCEIPVFRVHRSRGAAWETNPLGVAVSKGVLR